MGGEHAARRSSRSIGRRGAPGRARSHSSRDGEGLRTAVAPRPSCDGRASLVVTSPLFSRTSEGRRHRAWALRAAGSAPERAGSRCSCRRYDRPRLSSSRSSSCSGARFGIDVQHPFADRDLIDFVIGASACRQGVTRAAQAALARRTRRPASADRRRAGRQDPVHGRARRTGRFRRVSIAGSAIPAFGFRTSTTAASSGTPRNPSTIASSGRVSRAHTSFWPGRRGERGRFPLPRHRRRTREPRPGAWLARRSARRSGSRSSWSRPSSARPARSSSGSSTSRRSSGCRR